MAGFKEKEFVITKPTKLRDIISFDLPEERLVIIINDITGGTPDTELKPDDRVMMSPVFGGGCGARIIR